MKVNKAYKYRIYPNRAQRVILEKHFGCARFVYNHFLRQRIGWYVEHENDKKKGLNYHDTAAMLTQLRKQAEYTGDEIGINFGIKAFLTTSNAEVVQSPKYLRRAEKRLKRLQRSVGSSDDYAGRFFETPI